MRQASASATGYGTLHAWTLVALFCLLYMASFVDRMILALLADPVATSLDISDTQISLLVGIGFAALYVLIGLPLAQFVDAGYRRAVLLLGVVLWSFATIASGFVQSYAGLFFARACVAIGEAALTPVAISVIADMFSWKRRGLATSIYMGTGILMGSGAFVIGGAAAGLAERLTGHFDIEAWRLTFMIVGIPGLILAPFATMLIRRRRTYVSGQAGDSSVAAACQYLKQHARVYLAVFSGVGVISTLSMGVIVWLPTVMVRNHGLAPAEAGVIFGLVGSPAAVLGTILWPYVAQRMLQSGHREAVSTVLLAGAVIAATSIAATVTMTDLGVVMMGFALGMFALAGMTVMPSIVIQLYTPPHMKARLMALNLLFLNLLGLGSGPVLIAHISTYLEGTSLLALSIRIVALGAGIISLLLFIYCRPGLKRLSVT